MNRSAKVQSELKKTEYIEKDVVINDIGELFTICYETLPNEYGHHFIVEEELQTHLDFVRNLPAADVKPVVRGEWVPKNADGSWRVDTCSACKKDTHYVRYAPAYDFCPNCGADMRKTDND